MAITIEEIKGHLDKAELEYMVLPDREMEIGLHFKMRNYKAGCV